MADTDHGDGGTRTPLADADTVLLFDPPMDAFGHDVCIENLRTADPDATRVFRVEFTGQLEEWLRRWRTQSGIEIEEITVVNATGTTWSELPSWVTLATETAPSNLTGIGTAASDYLGNWEGTDGGPLVCIHSLTTLLQYVGTPQAFQFLHQLIEQARSADAFVHYHLTSGVHDEQTENLFRTLADAVIDVEADGTWTDASQDSEY